MACTVVEMVTADGEHLWEGVALRLEEHVDAHGWAAPRSLWLVRRGGHGESSVSFTDEVLFDTSPVDVLAGMVCQDDTVAGAAVAAEIPRTPGSPQVRLVSLVLRDGTEATVRHVRGTDATTVTSGVWLTWSLRRFLGLDSHAEHGPVPLPTPARILSRAAVSQALADSAAPLPGRPQPSELEGLLVHLRNAGQLPGWEQMLSAARVHYGQSTDGVVNGDASIARFLSWCDVPMWARYLDGAVPSMSELLARVDQQHRSGLLDSSAARELRELLQSSS